jgi:poly [ADP-ribose] polymerase
MIQEFEKSKSLGNIMELWHGSKVANLISILLKGYINPPSNASFVTGRLNGSEGIYLSDQSSKSLNYSEGYWSGESRSSRIFMFLNDVVMGNIFYPKSSEEAKRMKLGTQYHSIFVKAGVSGLYNNEMVVPVPQINPKYLCEFA